MTLKFSVLTSRLVLCIYLLAVLFLVFPAPAATPAPNSTPSLLAIGDVHGDYEDFCAILQRVQIIDEQRYWTGGNATFVQLGDVIDRGPKPRDVLDLMLSLDEQSAKAGGHGIRQDSSSSAKRLLPPACTENGCASALP